MVEAAPYPVATSADVLASMTRYLVQIDLALLSGVPVGVLVEHYGRTMAACAYVLAAMADDLAGVGP